MELKHVSLHIWEEKQWRSLTVIEEMLQANPLEASLPHPKFNSSNFFKF